MIKCWELILRLDRNESIVTLFVLFCSKYNIYLFLILLKSIKLFLNSKYTVKSYELFYDRTRKEWPLNTGTCLKVVTACAGLNVFWTASVFSVVSSTEEDHGFEPRLYHTKDYKIGMCCFSARHAALRSKSKDWLALNQNNVSEWGDMSIRGLLFQWASTIKIQLSALI